LGVLPSSREISAELAALYSTHQIPTTHEHEKKKRTEETVGLLRLFGVGRQSYRYTAVGAGNFATLRGQAAGRNRAGLGSSLAAGPVMAAEITSAWPATPPAIR